MAETEAVMYLTPDQLATAAAIMHALTWDLEDAHDEYDPYMVCIERIDEYVHVQFTGTSATRVDVDVLGLLDRRRRRAG